MTTNFFQSFIAGLKRLNAINLKRKIRLENHLNKNPNANKQDLDALVQEIREVDEIIRLMESGVCVLDQFSDLALKIMHLKNKDPHMSSLIILLQISNGNPQNSGFIKHRGSMDFGGLAYE